MCLIRLKTSDDREKGVALLEFAVTLPALVVLVGGVSYVGTALLQYFEMVQVAREGVRLMTNIQDLEPGTYQLITVEDETHCNPSSPSTTTASCRNQLAVTRKLVRLVSWHGYNAVDIDLEITTAFTTEGGREYVSVDLELAYPLTDTPAVTPMMRVSAKGPYLATS